jgi:N utilization substance protein B
MFTEVFENMKKTVRQIAREKAIIGIYQNLAVGADKQDIMNYVKHDDVLKEGLSAMTFCESLIDIVLKNKESYIKLIEKYLKRGWTFNRLSKMEQAILLVATAEILDTETDERVVINEAVINAKSFCDEGSYKFINGILHKVVS